MTVVGYILLGFLAGCGQPKCDDCTHDSTDCVPGTEVCNGIDDDCDGMVDNDAVDRTIWYEDVDGDLYGNVAVSVSACEAPTGFVTDNTDCDDAEALVHPGAEEFCDGVDDDCDSIVDEDAIDAAPWYADADADGYGNATVAVTACEAPPNFGSDDTDCDDADASVNPGEEEICDDGKDNDCDGQADECRLSGTVELGDVASEITDESGAVEERIELSGGCDVNGDGTDDLLVGVPDPMRTEYDTSDGDPGAVFVVLGGTELPSTLADAWSRISPEANELAGAGVACAGDVDADGHDDFWVAAPQGVDVGTVYLVTHAEEGDISLADSAVSIEESGSGSGMDIAAGSDLTGDGDFDVAFTDTTETRLRVFATPTAGTHDGEEATATINMPTNAIHSFDSHGDFDGDGIADLVVGTGTRSATGSVYIFAGPLSGTITDTDADASLDNAGDESAVTATAFEVAAAGDLDHNGLDDLAVGYTEGGAGTGEGELFVMSGPWSGVGHLVDSAAHVSGEHAYDNLGTCVANAGDVDGDGVADILVSAEGYDVDGAAYLFYGPLSGELSLTSGAMFVGHTEHQGTTMNCAGAGDLNGDGNADLAIAAGGTWDFSLNRVESPGRVYFVPGGGF